MKSSTRFGNVVFVLLSLAVLAFLVCPRTARAESLVINFEMNEGSGATVADLSGGGYPLTVGGATWSASGGGHTGLPGDYSLYYNGDWAASQTGPITGNLGITKNWTLGYWYKVDYPEWFSNTITGVGGWQINDGGIDGSYTVPMYFHGTGFEKQLTNLQWGDSNWYYYTLTSDGTNLYTYKDGALEDTISLSGNPSLPSFSEIMLGGYPPMDAPYYNEYTPCQGWIDGVSMFNATATAPQVADMMSGNYSTVGPVPEPSTMILLGTGLLGLLGYAWRRKRAT